jgi:hypothetical protein
MRRLSIILSVLSGFIFIYGLIFEKHELFSLADNGSKKINGLNLVEQSTFDGIVLKNGKLFDAYSLPSAINTPKDCKT